MLQFVATLTERLLADHVRLGLVGREPPPQEGERVTHRLLGALFVSPTLRVEGQEPKLRVDHPRILTGVGVLFHDQEGVAEALACVLGPSFTHVAAPDEALVAAHRDPLDRVIVVNKKNSDRAAHVRAIAQGENEVKRGCRLHTSSHLKNGQGSRGRPSWSPVRPTHRSKLLIPGGNLDDLALLHCEWTLGLDRFAALRQSRLAAGIPPDARPADLLGEHGDRWLFRFSLPTEHSVRTSAVRISATGEGVVVEHLVVNEDQRQHPDPSADSPETTRLLVDLPSVRPTMLRGVAPRVLNERDVPALVDDALMPQREAPIVLVSVDNATREPLLDPPELARRLAGMARVVWLSTIGASRRLKDELMARGFSDKFGCFHGGVRILWPGIKRGDDPYDHLLLLPVRLYPIPERVRAERVAGLFCEMIAEDEDLRARLREVEAPPRPEPLRRSTPPGEGWPRSSTAEAGGPRVVLGESRPRPPPVSTPWRPAIDTPEPTTPSVVVPTSGTSNEAPLSPAAEAIAVATPALESMPDSGAEAAATSASSVPASVPPEPSPVEAPHADVAEQPEPVQRIRAETTWSRLASDVVAAAELAEELEKDLEALRRELMDSRKAQRRAEQERDEAVEARFTAKTALEALSLAEMCFPDRLLVLASARASAETSPYRDPSRIFESLALLAFFGRHDGECEAAFQKVTGAGARWRPKDSPDTTARFGNQRTWAGGDGKRKLFRRHITLGHGVDAQRCAQIYYDVASDGRVELAWVGEHRPTVSEDT